MNYERMLNMKNYICGLCIFIVALLIFPMVTMVNSKKQESTSVKQDFGDVSNYKGTLDKSYKIYDTNTGSANEIPVRDYLIGAVFAQMPANFNEEAIKAQVLIAHTYIIRQHSKQQSKPDKSLGGADISNDLHTYQPYYTAQQAKDLYKDKYDEYNTKISKCVDEVMNKVILYNNQPIVASFHSMSGGMTESAEVAWGVKVPYLVSCDSSVDKECEGYSETREISAEEMEARLTEGFEGIKLDSDKSKWISITKRSDAQSVVTVTIGGKSFAGSKLKEILSIRSPYYDIKWDTDKFKIVTNGYGHGVGLSQYGANELAIKGSKYNDIITHYYKGVQIANLK